MTTSVKLECSCGQRYAFDVEPINGRMPSPVACPSCGADGTVLANQYLSQIMPVQPRMAPAGVLLGMVPSTAAAQPPPIPIQAARAPAPAPVRAYAPARPGVPMTRTPAAKSKARNDGWGTPETGFNKLGTYIMGLPAVFAAMISGGMFGGFEVPVEILCVVVGICGVIGGVINIIGRGPLAAGVVVGLVTALGAYGAVAWWIFGRKRVFIVEVSLAFIVGAIPGMALQYGLQQFLKKKRGA